jgi:hypothetical protein
VAYYNWNTKRSLYPSTPLHYTYFTQCPVFNYQEVFVTISMVFLGTLGGVAKMARERPVGSPGRI